MGNCFVTGSCSCIPGRSVLRAVRIDGKKAVLVKDVPVIGESRKVTEVVDAEHVGGGSMKKRIKVVITKQQLEDLLSKKISVEEVIEKGMVSPGSWRPRLESIPE